MVSTIQYKIQYVNTKKNSILFPILNYLYVFEEILENEKEYNLYTNNIFQELV